MMKYTFWTNLPSQSSDPKEDVTANEDVVVGKIKGVESVELVEPKEGAERNKKEKARCEKPNSLTPYIR